MATVVETLEIQFRANTGNVDKAARKTKQALKGLSGTKVNVSADTKDADKKLSDVGKKAKAIGDDASISVHAETREAMAKLDGLRNSVDRIDTDITINADTEGAEKSISSLMGVLKTSGLLMLAQKGFQIGMDLVNTSSNAEQSYSRLQGTLGQGALGTLQSYVGGLSSQYGFNETAIYDMASQFITLFKAYNYEEQEATDMGMRLIAQAIDYASFFNMTPSEVGQYFMSMLKGSYEVGDSIGMPLNATRLDEFAASRGIQGEDELATRAAAFVSYAENNAELVGLAGDWERTADQFANVSTVLGEQWQTLKEKAGTYLLPAATTVAQGLSDMLGALIAFTEEDAPDMENIFGGMSLPEEKINEIIADITGPTAELNSALNQSSGLLDKAVNRFSQEYTGLMELLNMTYSGGGQVTPETNDQIGLAVNAFADSALDAVNQSESTLTSMFLTFVGDESEWTSATETALANISNYFSSVKESISTKTEELRKLIWDSVVDDDIIDAFELGSITEKARELMQEVYESSMIQYGATVQDYIDRNMRSGQIDAKSAISLYEGAIAAADQEKAEMEANYSEVRRGIYEVAEKNRLLYEEDPDAYIAQFGAAPATAQEMLADADRAHQIRMAQMDADIINRLSPYFFTSMLDGMQEIAASEDMDFSSLMKDVYYPMEEFAEYAALLQSVKSSGGVLNADSEAFLSLYQGVMTVGGLAENVQVSADDSVELFRGVIERVTNDFYSGAYAPEGVDEVTVDAPGVVTSLDTTNGLLRTIAGKDFNVTINGYTFGKMVKQGGDSYHKVLGRE